MPLTERDLNPKGRGDSNLHIPPFNLLPASRSKPPGNEDECRGVHDEVNFPHPLVFLPATAKGERVDAKGDQSLQLMLRSRI